MSTTAAQILIFWICVGITVVVFGLMIYALIGHRKSVGHKAANFHEHTWIEIIWSVIPFLIVIALAAPAIKVLIHKKDSADTALHQCHKI